MKQEYRRGFSTAEKTELWDRWQRGESLRAIGRAFGKSSSSIYFQLAPHGGIRPAPRRRSRLALSLSGREEISRGIVAQHSIRSIASLLGRSPSTVSHEIRRNGGYDRYRAALADKRAWDGARRPKRCKLAKHPPLRRDGSTHARLVSLADRSAHKVWVTIWVNRLWVRILIRSMQFSHSRIGSGVVWFRWL
jgi:DNA-binding CsgD family transcriptional regulator